MYASVVFLVVATLVVGSHQMPQVPLASAVNLHVDGQVNGQANGQPNRQANGQANGQINGQIKGQVPIVRPAVGYSNHAATQLNAAGQVKTGPSVVLSSGAASRDQRPIQNPKPAEHEGTSNKKVRETPALPSSAQTRPSIHSNSPVASAHDASLNQHKESPNHDVKPNQAVHPTDSASNHKRAATSDHPVPASVHSPAATDAHHNIQTIPAPSSDDKKKPEEVKTTAVHSIKTREIEPEAFYVIDDPSLLAFDGDSSIAARNRRIKVLPGFLG